MLSSLVLLSNMLKNLDESKSKSEAITAVAQFIDSLGFRIIEEDTGKPWGAYFVIDEQYIDKSISEFFSDIKVEKNGKLTPKILLVAALYLEPKWVTVGLAAIFTVHYFIGAGISFILIKKHGVQIPVLNLAAFYLKLIFIFVLSIMPIWLARNLDLGGNLIYLLLVLSSSAFIYLVLLKALKISEVTTLIKVIKGRRE